jgi:conjugal transfer pilus assembly protein TraD
VVERVLAELAGGFAGALVGAWALAATLRRHRLRWTWATLVLPASLLVFAGHPLVFWPVCWASLLGSALGWNWHRLDLDVGADHAEAARARLGVRTVIARLSHRILVKRHGWINNGRLIVGVDGHGLPVTIPAGGCSGSHTLILGATGSGKTVSEAWVACRLIEDGHGAIVIDPKGDRMLRDQLAATADQHGRQFVQWTPEGPVAYNPYATGSATEIADKALAGETFTEPHYLRQAQRYLGHAIRAMHAADTLVTPVSLMGQLDPRELEVTARQLPDKHAQELLGYLDSLSDRQRRDLSGVRDRLSILAEADTHQWLHPNNQRPELEIEQAVHDRAVVYFRLDSDSRPLLAQMLAAALISDLISLVARLQANPVPTVVVIDEFSAVAAGHVTRLFARARSAGVSLILATQELADLKSTADGLREQFLGNVESVIAHRQNVPESAELIASMGGTTPVWVSTQQTDSILLGATHTGRGTRRRGHEFTIHPTRIKQLHTGQAVVLTPGTSMPRVARIHHPSAAK